MTKVDMVTSAILIVFSTAVTYTSLRMPTMADRNESPFSGPGVVPAFIGAMLFLLSLAMLIRSLRRGAARMFAKAEGSAAGGSGSSWVRIARTLALCVLYVVLLGKVWFPLLTFLFVFLFILAFEYDPKAPAAGQWKKPLFAAVLAAGASASVFLVFRYLFLVNLP